MVQDWDDGGEVPRLLFEEIENHSLESESKSGIRHRFDFIEAEPFQALTFRKFHLSDINLRALPENVINLFRLMIDPEKLAASKSVFQSPRAFLAPRTLPQFRPDRSFPPVYPNNSGTGLSACRRATAEESARWNSETESPPRQVSALLVHRRVRGSWLHGRKIIAQVHKVGESTSIPATDRHQRPRFVEFSYPTTPRQPPQENIHPFHVVRFAFFCHNQPRTDSDYALEIFATFTPAAGRIPGAQP